VGTYYDETLKICRPKCGVNEDYIHLSNTCDCSNGFVRINNACGKCPAGFSYQSTTKSCISICGTN